MSENDIPEGAPGAEVPPPAEDMEPDEAKEDARDRAERAADRAEITPEARDFSWGHPRPDSRQPPASH